MKKSSYLSVLLIFQVTLLYSQGIYFKASANYHISTNTKNMPIYTEPLISSSYDFYYNYHIRYQPAVYEPRGHLPSSFTITAQDFPILSGFNFQGGIGYSFNDFISFELNFSTFITKKKAKIYRVKSYDWNLAHHSLLPKLSFSQSFNKSTLSAFIFSGIGIAKLNITNINDNYTPEIFPSSDNYKVANYKFGNSLIISWGYGIEYAYAISSSFELFSNVGINNSYYEPTESESTNIIVPEYYEVHGKKPPVVKYKYVDIDKIKNFEDYENTIIKQTLKLNSIYLGFGIKYILKK